MSEKGYGSLDNVQAPLTLTTALGRLARSSSFGNSAQGCGGAGGVRHGIWYVHDPGGLFTIEGAAQGTYVLYVRGETAAGPLIGVASTDVSLGPVEDVRVTLRSWTASAAVTIRPVAGTAWEVTFLAGRELIDSSFSFLVSPAE